MYDDSVVSQCFAQQRPRLHAIALRLLGSGADAADVLQETWCRLMRADTAAIANLPAWLTTVVSNICLDMLRSGRVRLEKPQGDNLADTLNATTESDPERDLMFADAVTGALLVVLDRLSPPERVAFVLHDTFDVSFDQLAVLLDRSVDATKKLASRARLKVRGAPAVTPSEICEQRNIVDAFRRAASTGDLGALVSVLDPDVVRVADSTAVPEGTPAELVGRDAVIDEITRLSERTRLADLALVDGNVGIVVAPEGRLLNALLILIAGGRVVRYEVVAEPTRLAQLDIALL